VGGFRGAGGSVGIGICQVRGGFLLQSTFRGSKRFYKSEQTSIRINVKWIFPSAFLIRISSEAAGNF